MMNDIVGLVQEQIASSVRRAVAPAAFALIAALFVLFAIAGLFAALFFWLEPDHGPVSAALICAGAALVVAIVAALPLLFKRPKPAPPKDDDLLPRFVNLMAKSAPGLAPRQLIVTAAVLAAALILSSRGRGKKQG